MPPGSWCRRFVPTPSRRRGTRFIWSPWHSRISPAAAARCRRNRPDDGPYEQAGGEADGGRNKKQLAGLRVLAFLSKMTESSPSAGY